MRLVSTKYPFADLTNLFPTFLCHGFTSRVRNINFKIPRYDFPVTALSPTSLAIGIVHQAPYPRRQYTQQMRQQRYFLELGYLADIPLQNRSYVTIEPYPSVGCAGFDNFRKCTSLNGIQK